MTSETDGAHEIVIVRRRGGDDHDDHHGGVWKVAFADFMTAMMAFFLVLWIVNSTTKQTRSSLARYFNPIRLSDTTPARKGLNDPREVDFDASSDKSGHAEVSGKDGDAAAAPDARPGKSNTKEAGSEEAQARNRTVQAPGGRRGPPVRAIEDVFPGMKARRARTQPEPNRQGEEATTESESVKAAIEAMFGVDGKSSLRGELSVTQSEDGILISLTDGADQGSFSVGSFEPEEKLMRMLAAVASTLNNRPGVVIVRGHTDSRPYKRGGFDNWNLSFARAQTAFFGLVRGGLDEKRIERVEGYADRKPRDRENPNSPQNRRIEILLRPPSP